ncbi:hypothetical protein ACHAXH_002252 [Discostella pseudostelligera]
MEMDLAAGADAVQGASGTGVRKMELSSPSLLDAINRPATLDDNPLNNQTSNTQRLRRLKRRPPIATRTKPPSQDRLVIVFVTASAIFFLVTIFPFLSGDFPSSGISHKDWLHKHGDGHGGILDLAENKTLLLWHHLMGKQRQQSFEGDVSIINRIKGDPLPLARGVSGLPLSQTPALIGAHHGSIQCPTADGVLHMDELAYWNDPQGQQDVSFISPFNPQSKEKRYVTFEPDRGGWNNIRMSLENVIVFAAATGRTLVLPPDTPFYLLSRNPDGTKRKVHHGFADFLYLENVALRNKLEIISMTEFLETGSKKRRGHKKMFTMPVGSEGKTLRKSAEECIYVAKSDRPCDTIYDFLRSHAYVPELQAGRDCLIFDLDTQKASTMQHSTDSQIFDSLPYAQKVKVEEFCDERNPIFYGKELASAPWIHFNAGEKHHRLLNHFYTFMYFTDTKVDHYYKRFVRDFLHYGDAIYCAAGKVIRALEQEAKEPGSSQPSFSAMHVRRGDFQYKKVKITAHDWYNITKELFRKNEIIYIATDEKNRDFFKPLTKHYNLRFLSDFSDAAGLKDLDPNFMGMIDTIVASRGRLFVGTWFSTFTGYINRLRGYYGMPGSTSYYSTPERKFNTHTWVNPHKVMTAREWPTAWVGIDGDENVREERAI